ncbi:MAG: hypothetical protein Q8O67_03175 [Deltaproteobacteria bacterium]|nr:hypothetical protein [Deltaproteobacteria bacterium]
MSDRVYEMLWNCTACGTTGLLAKSQRRCPNCGSPQDESKRFFPKPGEETAVLGHKFEGADWTCGACTTPNGNAAAFCQNCGNPKEGNKSAVLQTDRIVKDGALQDNKPKAPVKKPLPKKLIAAVVVAVVVAIVVAVLLLVKKDVTVDVMAHSWTRTIPVERFEAAHESAWCDGMPGGAYNVSRHREQRGTKQVADGQECHDRQKDQGDGTFKVVNECKTKYKDEPVYDDKCNFTIDKWRHNRDEVARGGLAQTPTWPPLRLVAGAHLGSEREGSRAEAYTLQLRDAKNGKEYNCNYAEAKWRAVPDRSRHAMQVRLLGTPVCESLK